MSNPNDNDACKHNNKELLQVAENLLNKVNWAKYRISNFSIPIGITALSGFAILFALDYSLVFISEFIIDFIGDIHNFILFEWALQVFAIMTVVRGVASFLLLGKIIKFRSISSKTDPGILKVSLPRSTIAKLFVFSLVIMGAPLLFVYTSPALTQILFFISLPDFYLPVFVLLDISRMFLLC